MPAVGRLSGTPASISASDEPHTVAIDDEPFELGDLGDNTDGVGELFFRRQHRMDRPPGELAVTDFAAAGRADAAGFADRIRREVVVQQERFLIRSLQRVDELFVFGGAECGDHQSLGLATGKQRRAVGTRQHADFRHDLPNCFYVAAVDALAGVEDIPAHDLGFEFLEHAGNRGLVVFRFGAFREKLLHHLLLDRGDGVLPILLAHDRIGGAQILLGEPENFLLQRLIVGTGQLARLLGCFFGELDDGLDHRLEMSVAEHHGAEHDLFGQLFGFQLHHHDGVLRAGDDKIELTLAHLVDLRVEHIFVVYKGDAGAADRAHERRARKGQRGRGRNHRHDIGIVLLIVRKHGHGHLGVAAPAFGEQRTDRAIDQARRQRVLFGRTALTFEIAAGNPAGRVIFLGVVDGERKEIDACLRLLGGDDRGKHTGLAISSEHGSVGLTRHSAGFQG